MNIDHIYSVLERIEERQLKHNATLERLTVTVEHHEKRSTTLESEFLGCREECNNRINAATILAQSVERNVGRFILAIKWGWFLVIAVAGSVGFAVSVLEILDRLK